MKRLKINGFFLFGILTAAAFFASAAEANDSVGPAVEAKEEVAPKSELDRLKEEWEEVREQQIQMIREKEEQLEKFKEELFTKMKTANSPETSNVGPEKSATEESTGPILPVDAVGVAAIGDHAEFEAQKAAFQAEREKFFREINRQKEGLRALQLSLDEKARQLAEERERFERQKAGVA